jgi:hypothetical protein
MSIQMSSDATFVRDRLEIVNLIHSYAHHADSGNNAGFCALFLDDARIDIGFPGVDDKASLMNMMKQRPARSAGVKMRHVMSNMMFRSQTEDEATGALYFTLMSTEANHLTPLVTGQYTFTVARAGDEWRIKQWKAEMDGKLG